MLFLLLVVFFLVLCTFDCLLQVLQVELVLTHQTLLKLSELLSLLLHLWTE